MTQGLFSRYLFSWAAGRGWHPGLGGGCLHSHCSTPVSQPYLISLPGCWCQKTAVKFPHDPFYSWEPERSFRNINRINLCLKSPTGFPLLLASSPNSSLWSPTPSLLCLCLSLQFSLASLTLSHWPCCSMIAECLSLHFLFPLSGSSSPRALQGLLFLTGKISALNLPWVLYQWQTSPPSISFIGLHIYFLSLTPTPRRPLPWEQGLCLDHCYAWHRVGNKKTCLVILTD